MSDVLISARQLGKKFCRSLKRSLWYGVQDVARALIPVPRALDASAVGGEPAENVLRRGEFWALQDLTFDVRRGECLGLIGHNGAGKSTLLKILNGLVRPDTGEVRIRGSVAAMIELGAGFNPILTGRENIFHQAALLGFSASEVQRKFDEIVAFSEIEHALDMPLQNYSSGMKTRLGFAVYSHLEPDVLLIDEVLAVGDVGFRMKSLNKMADLMQRCAVIFVTHSMPQVFRVCTELIVLDHGRIHFKGSDISGGVQQYYHKFQHGSQPVTGSGDAAVSGLQARSGIETAALGGTLGVRNGEDVQVDVTLRFRSPHSSGTAQLLIWNQELLPVMDIIAAGPAGFRFAVDADGNSVLRAAVSNVRLNTGLYSMSVIVLSEDSMILCRHDGALTLNVVAGFPSAAYVLETAQWAQL